MSSRLAVTAATLILGACGPTQFRSRGQGGGATTGIQQASTADSGADIETNTSGAVNSNTDYQSNAVGSESSQDQSSIKSASEQASTSVSNEPTAASRCKIQYTNVAASCMKVALDPNALLQNPTGATSICGWTVASGGGLIAAEPSIVDGNNTPETPITFDGGDLRAGFQGSGASGATLLLAYPGGDVPSQVTITLDKPAQELKQGEADCPAELGGVPCDYNAASMAPKTLSLAPYLLPKTSVYAIPFSQFVAIKTAWAYASITLHVVNTATGQEDCTSYIYESTPLVLDLSGSGSIQTITPDASNVDFRIDRSGIARRTGWITGNAGFLALDRNHNGKIDDASELFGNHTPMGKVFAKHGFEALGYHDANHDSSIDKHDPIFENLLVWVDVNQDGVSQSAEIRPLRHHGITEIRTTYTANHDSKNAVQGHGPFINRIPIVGKFFGPKNCGSGGCQVGDVYFGTMGDAVAKE